jgi:hypothetical protein
MDVAPGFQEEPFFRAGFVKPREAFRAESRSPAGMTERKAKANGGFSAKVFSPIALRCGRTVLPRAE